MIKGIELNIDKDTLKCKNCHETIGYRPIDQKFNNNYQIQLFLYANKIGLSQKNLTKDLVNIFDQHAADNSIQDILVLSEIQFDDTKLNGLIVKIMSN